MVTYKFLIKKFKFLLKILFSNMDNTVAPLRYQGKANIWEFVDILSIIRYYFFDPLVRLSYLLGRIRYESLFFFLFRGKIKNKSISEFAYVTYGQKFFTKKIRTFFWFSTLCPRLNFFRNKNKMKALRIKFFAVSYIIILGLIILGIIFTIKDTTSKNYYTNLYDELFSKGFWKGSIFKVFLFKGENYIEDMMQYEGNSVLSLIRVLLRKIIILYNTYYITLSVKKNKKIKKFS